MGFSKEINNFYRFSHKAPNWPTCLPGFNEQHIKISHKNFFHRADKSGPSTYYLTKNGLCFSDKNTKTMALMIGRQKEALNEIRPNDIV